ncbi:glucose-6-phosphate isomerase [Candidatus Rariloculus sp.]|uniref:glucose-6-phosphate isomerase n=1 Tax=Candidatus Rariloculus sp. TaxID=3101265 RepID=UPI003D09D9A4
MTGECYGPRTAAWQALRNQADVLSRVSIESLFQAEPARFDAFSVDGLGLLLDFSRQWLDEQALTSLLHLAEQTRVAERIEQMFEGEPINNTEGRAALHVALRRRADQPLPVSGSDVMPLVESERAKMRELANQLLCGALTGFTGQPITDVVNIGIGGSDLGVVMAAQALREYRNPDLGIHFVSNVDGVQLYHVLEQVAPATTLFVICSKSFTTLETLTNARTVRAWLHEHGGDEAVASQCVAVSTNHEAMDEFGIAPERRFAIWDWVGGRFSIWSAVGLALALAIGWRNFEAMLAGGHAMDEHFRRAPFERNLPVLLALIGVWNRNFLDAGSHAVLPYDDHLSRLPAFLQQLEMESNGKSVRRNGEPVECVTCPIVWGESGSNAQHSFYQLLHQGTDRISIDFLLPARSGVGGQAQQDLAAVNCLAQTLALATGDPAGAANEPHREYRGNRPSSLLLFERLDPGMLGKLIALYEHKTFVQGVIWDVNSFDQWGVELGKRLASRLTGAVGGRHQRSDPEPIAGALDRLRGLRPRSS